MTRHGQWALTLGTAAVAIALGMCALSAGERLRTRDTEYAAHMRAVEIGTTIQKRLFGLRDRLASPSLATDRPFQDEESPADVDNSMLIRWVGGEARSVPAGEPPDETLGAQLRHIREAGIYAPLTNAHGRDLVLVVERRDDGLLAVAIPADTLIGPPDAEALVPESLELRWAGTGANAAGEASIFRVTFGPQQQRRSVEFLVPGGTWRLLYDDQAVARNKAVSWSLYGVVLLITYLLATVVYRLCEKPRALNDELRLLSDRFTRLNDEMRLSLENRESTEQRIHQLFVTDPETALPNRQGFVERIQNILAALRRAPKNGPVSIVIVGLRDLELAEHTFGHSISGAVLPEVVRRIRDQFEDEIFMARTNTCQLAVILPNCDTDRAIQRVAEIANSAVTGIYGHPSGNINVAPCFGIVGSSDGYTQAERLLDDGIAALSDAEAGGGRWSVLKAKSRDDRVTMIQLGSELRSAVDNNEFRIYYQPIVRTHSGKPRGFECLLRWQHPVEGLLPPARFIPLSESSGLVTELTRWVMREAVRQAAAWRNLRELGCYLSINLSTLDLLHAPLVDDFATLVRNAGLTPDGFRLEITESTLIGNMAQSRDVLCRLRDAGFRIMMDDFGTGFSSLSYLRRLPFSAVKIDKSFTQAITWDAKNYGMLRGIIDLIHFLEMETILEGVETEEQHDLLRQLDPVYCQGYLYARPMAAIDAEEYLAAAMLEPRAVSAVT